MSTVSRIRRMLGGALLGLVLVEGSLQAIKLAVSWRDHQQTHHALASHGGDLRVLCLGACYTIGIGTGPEEAYPAQLEGLLDGLLAPQGGDAVVINGGQRGKSIDHFAGQIDSLLRNHQPDVLVVGVNRRTSADASASAPSGLLAHFILPKLVGLALSPVPPPSSVTADPLAVEIAHWKAVVDEDPGQLKAWSELSTLYAHRGDFAAARAALAPVLERRVPPPPPLSLRLFRYAIAMGEMEEADAQLAAVRSHRGFVKEMARTLGARSDKYAKDERNVLLRTTLDEARLRAVQGELEQSRRLLEECLRLDPDTADAWHLLAWLDHAEGRPAQPRTEAFLGERSAPEGAGGADFAEALGVHLDRILAATAPEGVTVVLHTLAASPEQLPIIAEVAAERGVPVIDVQTALTAVPDPEPLFHPTDHLRFSAAGNAWLAQQVYDGLMDAGLTASP